MRGSSSTRVVGGSSGERASTRQRVSEKIVTLAQNKEMHDLFSVARGPSAKVAAP